jgi:hypothetical protein
MTRRRLSHASQVAEGLWSYYTVTVVIVLLRCHRPLRLLSSVLALRHKF